MSFGRLETLYIQDKAQATLLHHDLHIRVEVRYCATVATTCALTIQERKIEASRHRLNRPENLVEVLKKSHES